MEKLEKILLKLTKPEQKEIINLIQLILENNLSKLDVKKLKGYKDVYRVRSGKMRIIFRRQDDDISVLEISRRNDNTYRNY